MSVEVVDTRAKEMNGGKSSILQVSYTCFSLVKCYYLANPKRKDRHILPAKRQQKNQGSVRDKVSQSLQDPQHYPLDSLALTVVDG